MDYGELLKNAWAEEVVPNIKHPAVCILATKVTIEALSYFGARVIEMPVSLFVANPPAIEWLSDPANDQNDAKELMPPEAHTIGISPDMRPANVPEGEGYDGGHMVALVENELMFDLALPQINRDKPSMNNFEPSVIRIDPEFYKGESFQRVVINDCYLDYKALPHLRNSTYRKSNDWGRNADHFSGRVIRHMKAAIKNG